MHFTVNRVLSENFLKMAALWGMCIWVPTNCCSLGSSLNNRVLRFAEDDDKSGVGSFWRWAVSWSSVGHSWICAGVTEDGPTWTILPYRYALC